VVEWLAVTGYVFVVEEIIGTVACPLIVPFYELALWLATVNTPNAKSRATVAKARAVRPNRIHPTLAQRGLLLGVDSMIFADPNAPLSLKN
jgi:hypothetical protein